MREYEYKINFKPPPRALTRQQQAICDLIMEGLSTKHIARKLGVGPRTVEIHKREIYIKMEVQSAVQLMRKIYEGRIAELTASMVRDSEVVERAMAAVEKALEKGLGR